MKRKSLRKRRKPQKPVQDEHGNLLTPVTRAPAAKINWAGPCPACRTRRCLDENCRHESPHRCKECQLCGNTELSEPHRGRNTKATGTIDRGAGREQKAKCYSCGHNWTVMLPPPIKGPANS